VKRKKIRVLHAPTTVGGNPHGLSQHLKLLDVESTTLTLLQNYLNYPADIILWKNRKNIIRNELKRIFFILMIPFKYDVVHYNFGTTISKPLFIDPNSKVTLKYIVYFIYSVYSHFLQKLELNFFKICNIPIFVHYQGSDARQADYCLKNYKYSISTEINEEYYGLSADEYKRKSIKYLTNFCEEIYAVNPDLMNVLPANTKFIPYCHISFDDWTPIYNQNETDRMLRIGHAPTNRKVKGTQYILDALDELRNEGYKFELVLVESVSNTEARELYESIDVLVDQLFAGWYGGLAVEVMALGKPVLVYIREDDLKFIPKEMKSDLPFINVTPDTIKNGLRNILNMSKLELLELAKQSRHFVEKWHNPEKIAYEIKDDYLKALNS